jgi:hypothetical protein
MLLVDWIFIALAPAVHEEARFVAAVFPGACNGSGKREQLPFRCFSIAVCGPLKAQN